jgi:acetylornithine deacetylase/succinyl-diaminopimelate desuccinylase-like protein
MPRMKPPHPHRTTGLTAALLLLASSVPAQTIDWPGVSAEAVDALQQYVRIDTSNPPGDTSRSAAFLTAILEREGIPVTRYESAPGKVIIVARLEGNGTGRPILLEHHMDVVPADRSRWPRDPFGAELVNGEIWGRGTVDMKGLGIIHLFAFLELKRQQVPLARDVILMAVPDEEVGGELGARWMIEHHLADLNPEYVLDEGGTGSRDLYADGKLIFGISVAEKKIMWLKLTAEGLAGHGSQPHDQNPNDKLVKALARLVSEPLPSGEVAIVDELKAKAGTLASNKYINAITHSTISLTTLRSGVGDPPKLNVIPSIAEATLDCRLLPGVTADAWLAEIRRRLGDPSIKIDVTYESEDSVVTPQDTPLYRALASAIERYHPGAVVSPILVPFGTDSNAFRHHGAKSYGIYPIAVPAEIVGSMHGDAERVPAAEIGTGVRIMFEALRDTVRQTPLP